MVYRAVIFDLDGTLIHTTPDYRYIVIGKTLKEFNKSTRKDLIDDIWFRSEHERTRIVREEFRLDLKEFWQAFKIHDTIEARREHTKLYDDVSILPELKKRGMKTGLVTSAPEHIMNMEIGMLNHTFNSVVRAQLSGGFALKPSPQGIEHCLNEMSVEKNDAVYVGNSKEDMQMAANAGMQGILINRKEYDFGDVKSDLMITSLYELRTLFGIKAD